MTGMNTGSPASAKRFGRSNDKGLTYTEEEREDAALVCAIAASNPDLAQSYSMACVTLDLEEFDADGNEHAFATLAFAAWQVTQRTGCANGNPDAEAEALIRTGWTP